MSNPTQYYPTPPEAVIPLREWLDQQLPDAGTNLLDPCAGRGALPLFIGGPHRWRCLELLSAFRADLMAVPQVDDVRGLNALHARWPPWHVVANPPYGRELVAFAERIAVHCRKHRVIGAMLSRVTFWGEGTRSDLDPDLLLWIRGRISFTGDGKADSSSHCWAIWLPLPGDGTRVRWCDKGTPTDEEVAAWRAMLGLEGSQIGLFKPNGQRGGDGLAAES